MAGDQSSDTKDLKVEYLPDDGGVKVNGVWYSSLASFFEDREALIKNTKK